MAPVMYGFSPWLDTFVMFENNTKKVLWIFAPS